MILDVGCFTASQNIGYRSFVSDMIGSFNDTPYTVPIIKFGDFFCERF